MKVVLFCGGLGTRLREHSETIPKPLVHIGQRPILWHLMRYYAHFGHKDFILCLGYRGDLIRQFFLSYNECMSNDFVLSTGGKEIELLARDMQDWRITFVDTGLNWNIGQRLLRVRRHLAGERAFLANYADGLSDLPLDRQIADFERRGVTASFVAVPPPQSFHGVQADDGGLVTAFGAIRDCGFSINAGFFCLRADIFDYIREGDELVKQPFQRLIAHRQLAVFRYDGFWQPMDTFKDKVAFDKMDARGECPWMLWKQDGLRQAGRARRAPVPMKAVGAA
jgi:glucose-1-phosphate cytidylyltransferase